MNIAKCTKGHLILYTIIQLSIMATATACTGKTMIHAGILSEYEKQIIVDLHNRVRQSVAMGQVRGQPPAANMMEMKWDEELAAHAQAWASSCISDRHDNARHIRRFLVGQNIASTWTTRKPVTIHDSAADFARAVAMWFDEVKGYTFGRVSNAPTKSGHYTQLVWSETTQVGCGYSFLFDPHKGFTKIYVCNYGPSGNIISQTPYQKGPPSCSNFGLEQSRKYIGLCDKPSKFFFDISTNYIG